MDILNVKNELRKILEKSLEKEIIIDNNDEDNLINLYGINSIDALEIFMNIEILFDIQIPDEDLSSELFTSLNYLCEYILSIKCSDNVRQNEE